MKKKKNKNKINIHKFYGFSIKGEYAPEKYLQGYDLYIEKVVGKEFDFSDMSGNRKFSFKYMKADLKNIEKKFELLNKHCTQLIKLQLIGHVNLKPDVVLKDKNGKNK